MDTAIEPREPPGPATETSLVGLTRAELGALVAEMDEPAFRARQLWQQIYNRGARDFGDMTDLSKAFRQRLEARFTLDRPLPVKDELSADGTRKWLLRFADGNEAETVYIPEEDRGALCISSQVGCTLNCRFCHTGTQRMVRNLEVREIVGQLMVARDALGEWPSPTDDRRISNIVMMGMGEPLYNFENVRDALHVVMDGDGISISKRRITLSTAGVVPMMRRCGEEIDANLAVSLHAVTDEVRDAIVPLNRKYPLAELMQACREYPGAKNARRITFEYVMLHGVNDTEADARELVRLLEGIPSKVNLIPFNPWPGAPFERSRPEAIRRFTEIVNAAGRTATVRTPRGEDIMAACGQLKSASEKLPARLRAKAAAAGA